MTTIGAHLAQIDRVTAHIDTLNRNSGPVWDLLPALVERSRHQARALDRALELLGAHGPVEADEDDILRLQGRLRTLAEREAERC